MHIKQCSEYIKFGKLNLFSLFHGYYIYARYVTVNMPFNTHTSYCNTEYIKCFKYSTKISRYTHSTCNLQEICASIFCAKIVFKEEKNGNNLLLVIYQSPSGMSQQLRLSQ